MGCVECKICKQDEEKNQFEYNNETSKKIENEMLNTTKNKSLKIENNSNNFLKEFNEKLQFIGKYISEEEFELMIPESANDFIKKESFPFLQKENILSYKMAPVEFENGNIYNGNWNESIEMEGYGKYYLKEEKVLVEGIWEKGQLKYARIFYPNDEFYEGEMANSSYNGKGKLISENKDVYIGDFIDGEKNGEGKLIFNDDETEYNGKFLKGNLTGYGNMKWKSGIEYEGNFNDNFFDGKGVLSDKHTGDKYEGNFDKNLFHGKGKYTYGNGDEYEGNFEYGIRKGKGIYRKKGGFVFEGTWDNNVPNGFGKIIYNDNIIKSNFHNGNLVDTPIYETNGGSNDIDFNFYNEPMILSSLQLSHLETNDLMSSQYRAGARLSFLED